MQYLEHPADPRYEGASVVVNFIMPEYKVGGVTRVNLFQRFPNNGYYTAASKLVRNNWSYPSGYMFQQFARYLHLLFHEFIEFCIVEGSSQFIGFHGSGEIIAHIQIHHIIVAHLGFL